jgi:hypothetical protein
MNAFVMFHTCRVSEKVLEEQTQILFEEIDADKSGEIDEHELEEHLVKLSKWPLSSAYRYMYV